ncbi:helix-turn-helix transcriptional regulator [Subdoligranulum variabile]|uniref:helix-turn-helix transcriptional regulator n=1 Tax=Subdoligranulum variabile TaxID=214851 RepID=UPI003BF90075
MELKKKGLSQKRLAKYLGITESSIQNKLHGKTQFSLKEMRAIQTVFKDYSLDYLFTEYNKKE